jgi:hypothetical protein
MREIQMTKTAGRWISILNPFGCIPRSLLRIRHTGESRYPENPTGFRVKHGMTA